MACPTRAGRAEKGAGYSFWASHRECLEEATPTNPVPPMSREQVPHTRWRDREHRKDCRSPQVLSWLGGQGQGGLGCLPLPGNDSLSPASGHNGPSSLVGPVLVQPTLPGHTAACCTSHARLLEVYSLPTLTAGPLGLPKLLRGSRPVTLKTVRSLNSLVWGYAALS